MNLFEDVNPTLPGGAVLIAVVIGGLAVAGCILLTARAVTVGMNSYGYGRRPAWVWSGGFAILLLVAAVVCWVVASATADPDNGLATIFLKLRPFAYLAGGGLGVWLLWNWR